MMQGGEQVMGKRRGETPEDEGKQPPKAAERGGEERERAEREEPGTGGLSKAAYDAATEKAVKDIHG